MTVLHYPFEGRSPTPDEVITVSPGVHWRRVPVPGPLQHVNCWLLDDDGGVAIVDTGYQDDATRDGWAAAIAGRRVTQVICTHYHPDHSGLAGWLCREYRAPLVMTRVEWLSLYHFVAGSRVAPEEIADYWRAAGWDDAQIARSMRGWSQFGAFVSPPPQSFRRIADGDRIALGGAEWRVVVGSGHSPEHACLLDEHAGVLIAGDQVLPAVSPNVSVTLSEPEGDPLGDWLASIERLRLLDGDLLVLPGHGDPFHGLHARLDAIAMGHHRRLDRLHALLAEPRRVVDCFPALFRREVGAEMIEMATGETLAHLHRLEHDGRTTREMHDGVTWFAAA
ncbi:MAG: MBL fold metallo-hydrolase [Candidatus Sphingomonas colombiensis]|nr:MBL fold metallo-hydrolase [Sphingomonas sp.]WEK42042.1 MAG: MBL fold metallo-hydrolase [Sphingomonas sp.]